MKKILILILVLFTVGSAYSQDTLPKFTIVERGGKVIISWINPFQSLIQLNVQRSYDSLKNYSTIYSTTSPELPQNGYTDTKVPTNKVFYRLFYVQEGGAYFFTKAKRASVDGGIVAGPAPTNNNVQLRDYTSSTLNTVIAGDKRVVTIKIKESVYKQLSINSFRSFKDSILHLTKDTLYSINDSLVTIRPYVAREEWKASNYIFANKEGYINISLPQVLEKKYNVKFFEENGAALFEIHNVKESPLILDKSSFIHAGWFLFELYEDNKLKEKNRFYLPKDF